MIIWLIYIYIYLYQGACMCMHVSYMNILRESVSLAFESFEPPDPKSSSELCFEDLVIV